MLEDLASCAHEKEEWFSRERSRLVDVGDWKQAPGGVGSHAWAEKPEKSAALLLFPDLSARETVSDQYRKNLEVVQLLVLWEEQGTDEDLAQWEAFEAELEAARHG